MKKVFTFIFISSLILNVFADINQICKQADELDENGEFISERYLLLEWVEKTTNPKEKAELFWRLARTYLNIAEENKEKGMEIEKFKYGVISVARIL